MLQDLPKTFPISLWEFPCLYFGKGWVALGRNLGSLGPLSEALGRSRAFLGRLWGVPGALLVVSGALLEPLGRILGDLAFILKGFREGWTSTKQRVSLPPASNRWPL